MTSSWVAGPVDQSTEPKMWRAAKPIVLGTGRELTVTVIIDVRTRTKRFDDKNVDRPCAELM